MTLHKMLVSFTVSAKMSEDLTNIEDYVWSGNIPIEGVFHILARILVLEAEKKAKEEKKE